MNIVDIITRISPPGPWSEGEKIPWNDPGFSSRMLHEHLSQEHDAASRRASIIDRQVTWIFGSVLDLGCGPGLYTSRLAQRGCPCTGIDFSPASIAYARSHAQQEDLDCRYIEGDLRTTAFGDGFGLVMFLFGEFNVFRPEEAALILQKAYQALDPGGILIIEPHTFEAVRELGSEPSTWYTAPAGLFSPQPHLCLQESFWDQPSSTVTERYFIVDAHTGTVTRFASTMQAYTNDEYSSILTSTGFTRIQIHPSLEGIPTETTRLLFAITAVKPDR